jgi:hypothetical protein
MLGLAPGLFLAPIRGRAIVLDLNRDRYLALPPALARAAAVFTSATPPPLDDDATFEVAVRALVAQGILAPYPANRPRRPEAPPGEPATTLWPSDAAESYASPAAVHLALAQVWWRLRTHRLADTITWIRRERRRSGSRDDQAALDTYYAARPWFPVKPICRLDALALYLYLAREGCNPQLIFGVMLEPLAAHCWVQVETQVVNEPHEVVAGYTPIMVIRPR